MTGRRGRRRKQLSYELKEARGYCKKKEEALDHTLWRTPLWKRLWTFRKTDNAFMNERNKFSYSPKRPGRWGLPSLLLYRTQSGWDAVLTSHFQLQPRLGMNGVRNEWSYTSTPPICLQGVDGDTYTSISRQEPRG
jgi:hypothetical protein